MNEDQIRDLRHRLDEHQKDIVNFNTAQSHTNDRLDSIDETLDTLDRTLRGDIEGHHDGIMARLEKLERSSNQFFAILLQDSTGKKGLVATVESLVTGRMDAVERRKSRASVIIAMITSAALVITNLDRLGEAWIKLFGKSEPTELELKIKRAKTRRVVHVVPRRVIDYSQPPAPEPSE